MNPSLFRALRWLLLSFVGLLLVTGFALACSFVYIAPSLPTAATMHNVELSVPLRVYSRTGGLMSQIGEQRRIPVRYEDIPPLVRQAVLAAEDDRFFQHSGLDWMGVARAVLKVAVSGSAKQGGSTITQQAARNMFLSLDKTLRRKLAEVFVTYRMERDFTKEQILATYLNVIFFGQRSYGIAAAAETFYGKRLEDLSVAQAATLAGIIQLPSRYNPVTNPKGAEMRRAYVLDRMTKVGYIDAATAAKASREPVASRGFAPLTDVDAPYVAELARQEIVRRFGEAAVNGGYKVFTTLDGRLQAAASRAVRVGLIEYDRRHGYRGHLGKVELSPSPADTELDQKLAEYSPVSLLQPAVVTAVADASAEVYVRGQGKAKINWDGLAWARAVVKGGLGANPRKAMDVVKRGDVIYVISDRRGNAQLAQLPQAQSALVALDPTDGAIVAMVGGFDFHTNNFNRVTQAQRQPGSGFKPFLYSAALENGFTPSSVILDMPVILDNSNAEDNWRPKNSDREFRGPTRLREALVGSRNMVSIRILQSIGIDAALNHAAKFGFRTDSFPRNFTLALGTQTVSPLEMATGFAVFANGGFKVAPYFISRIEDSTGKLVYEAQPVIACTECEQPTAAVSEPLIETALTTPEAGAIPPPEAATDSVLEQPLFRQRIRDADEPEGLRALTRLQGGLGYLSANRLAPRVISAQNAWLMNSIMHDVATRGTAVRTNQLGRDDLAGKTGTNGDRDTWFNGFNGSLVATVWVGFDNEQSLGANEEGSSTAVPLWNHFMREALRSVPSNRMERPSGLIDLRVSRYTGALADAGDPDAITETFMLQHQPRMPEAGEAQSNAGSGEPLF
ncbi:MAG: transglycosylase domain-containing protein [Steroidobacteraceae bacterium]